jgi:peptide/nickel transport system permease protein
MGFFGGLFDMSVMRVTDVMLSFPSILLALFVITVFGRSLTVLILALAVLFLPGFIRLARSLGLSLRNRGYVEASEVAGASSVHVVWWHLLPNATGPLLVGAAATASWALVAAATLSYLGLGTQLPDPSWGNMLQSAFGYLFQTPWYGIIPGVCITLVALAYTWIADGIEEVTGADISELAPTLSLTRRLRKPDREAEDVMDHEA